MRATPFALCGCVLAFAMADGRAQAPPPGTGPDPALPPPHHRLIPRVDIAPAVGWRDGEAPTPAAGLVLTRFASGLDHPRWLLVLPNGDVLVAESNGPAGKGGIRGIKGAVMKMVMKRAGAGVPSAERITLLRDADHDGVAELRQPFLEGLHSPFGMALVGDTLYVANADAIVSVPYASGQTRSGATPSKLVDLPGKGEELNHHWTKSLLASADGRTLFVGVGSNSNAAENGLAAEAMRAAILEVDVASCSIREYATGLRNPVGLAWAPDASATLWAVVNERDELGDELVPDYLTSVRPGAFYGWPWSYWGANMDARVKPANPEMVARATRPDYALGNHVAPLGLAFHPGGGWSQGRPGALVALHGSWNRKPLAGYEVAFVPFADGRPAGPMQPVLGGFLDADGQARGRPVGIAVQADGGILVADDVGNTVWRLAPAR